MVVPDGGALLAAAIRAACLAKAPRRTVQAVAAAVTGVLVRFVATDAAPASCTGVPTRPQRAATPETAVTSAEDLLQALRVARSTQRRRKKERRKAAKVVACSASAQEVKVTDRPVGVVLECVAPGAAEPRLDAAPLHVMSDGPDSGPVDAEAMQLEMALEQLVQRTMIALPQGPQVLREAFVGRGAVHTIVEVVTPFTRPTPSQSPSRQGRGGVSGRLTPTGMHTCPSSSRSPASSAPTT